MRINTKPVHRYSINVNYIRYFFVTLLAVALFIIQMTPGCIPAPWNIRAQLVIPFVVCVGASRGEMTGLVYGLLAGLMWDSVSPEMWGYHTFILAVAGCLSGLTVKYLFRKNAGSVIFLCGMVLVLYLFLYWFFFIAMRGYEGAWRILLFNYLPSTVYTMIYAVPICGLIRLIFGKYAFREI